MFSWQSVEKTKHQIAERSKPPGFAWKNAPRQEGSETTKPTISSIDECAMQRKRIRRLILPCSTKSPTRLVCFGSSITESTISIRQIQTLALAASLLLICGCGGSAGGMLSTGRTVFTHSDSVSLESTFSQDTATIKTAGKTIVVAPQSLIVDGVTVADIAEKVSKVDVSVKRGVVTFVADGRPVETTFR